MIERFYPYLRSRLRDEGGIVSPRAFRNPTRRARVAAHAALHRLWLSGIFADRRTAYRWLAVVLDRPPHRAHIAQCNRAECLKIVAAARSRAAGEALPIQERPIMTVTLLDADGAIIRTERAAMRVCQ